jgi:hypothetical protein
MAIWSFLCLELLTKIDLEERVHSKINDGKTLELSVRSQYAAQS